MKIGTITFHAAHNYGSVLQTYALQTFIMNLLKEYGIEGEYWVLNYRSVFQKQLYDVPQISDVTTFLKWLMYKRYKTLLSIQDEKFEQFISSYLHITEEFNDEEKLHILTDSLDTLIAGSDQIWNIRARDFSYAYLFEGCNNKKISYATSLGPLMIDWNLYDIGRYIKAIKQFDNISVREEKSRQMLESLLNNEIYIGVNIDPTLLLPVNEWRSIQSNMCPRDGKYILFYCLEPNKDHIRIAKMISKEYGLPVVATRYRNKYDYFNPFIKQYDAGPRDFLSLVDHAELVLTSSFHGTAFSLIYGKPFYVIDGMKDGRISNILKKSNAVSNAIDLKCNCVDDKAKAINAVDFIELERKKSKEYLVRVLGI